MKPITLYTANCRGDRFNTTYPVRRVIASDDDLRDAAQYDQVFAEYKNAHRAIADFITINVPPSIRVASFAIADKAHPGMLSELEFPSDQLRVAEVRLEPRPLFETDGGEPEENP